MITGVRRVAGFCRSFFRICRPSSSGSMMSSRIMEGTCWDIARQKAEGASKPWASKPELFRA